ncbi:MAG TPA: adenosine deaminase [Candidatus Binatia bacterium]
MEYTTADRALRAAKLLGALTALIVAVNGCATRTPPERGPEGLPSKRVVALPTESSSPATARAAAWFEAQRHRLPMLRAFVQRMPKGGELHSHLSGAVYAESYLQWAAEGNFCVDLAAQRLVPPPCKESDQMPLAKTLLQKNAARDALINKLSTRNLDYAGQSGHDQFFASFGGFGAASNPYEHGVEMLTEVANRAASQNIQYLEIMLSFEWQAVGDLAARMPKISPQEHSDFGLQRQWLLANGLGSIVARTRSDLNERVSKYRKSLRCDNPLEAQPACNITVRLIAQSTRTNPPENVFAQLVFAFELAGAEPRVVGINLVAPEDHPVALRDYNLHMRMVGYLASQLPKVNIALHAGELTMGLVRPEDLRFHIRQAVEIAKARRIGHGVDILYENEPFELMAKMKRLGVALEICLTSNDVILNVKGADHPLPVYLEAGVPVTLASDDEGVARIDLSNEFLRAARDYGLTYPDLKRLARNSLEYSFLPGESLWQSNAPYTLASACAADAPGGTGAPAENCRKLLERSERAREQWRLEAAFTEFENLPWLR